MYRNNTNSWNLDLTIKIESYAPNTKELTLAVWMDALLNNVGGEMSQDLLRRYIEIHWDSVLYSADPDSLIVKRPGKIQ